MTLRPLSFLALVGALSLSACGGDDTASTTTPATPAPAAEAPAPAPAAEAPPAFDGPAFEITLTPLGDQMKYEQTEFTVKPGQTVRLTFQNTATMAAMKHNVVVLQQGANANEIGQAAMQAADNDYIPTSKQSEILAFTPMSDPGETVEVEFTAPGVGEYTFICTYPGHYMTMRGTMRVVA